MKTMPVFVASGYALMLKLRHSWRRRGSNSVRNGAICRHGRNLLVVSSVCRSSLLAAGGARGGPKKTDLIGRRKRAARLLARSSGQVSRRRRSGWRSAPCAHGFAAFVSNWPGSKRYFATRFVGVLILGGGLSSDACRAYAGEFPANWPGDFSPCARKARQPAGYPASSRLRLGRALWSLSVRRAGESQPPRAVFRTESRRKVSALADTSRNAPTRPIRFQATTLRQR